MDTQSTEVDVMLRNRLVGSNGLILHQVFGYLNVKQLKNCRLVNRNWYENCQSIMKKKSVIKFHFHRKENKRKDPKRFLDAFQTSPLKNTFSGVRILLDESVISVLFNERNENCHPAHLPIMEFVSRYGPQLTYFELRILDQFYISYQVIAIKEILVDLYLLPNIEEVRVVIEWLESDTIANCRVPNISNIASPDSVKLNNLKKLQWSVVMEINSCSGVQRGMLQKMFSSALTDIIAHAPNLESITTEGSLLSLDAFKTLHAERVSTLKQIEIDPIHGFGTCYPSELCLLEPLTILGNQNLKLEHFTVNLYSKGAGWDCRLLSKFMFTQKDCLKTLKICIQYNSIPATLDSSDIPIFPEIPKLEQLRFCYTDAPKFEVFFGQLTNWTDLFPALKLLEITYDDNSRRDELFLPRLITESTATNNQIQVLRLSPCNWRRDFIINKYGSLFDMAKQKFPNIKNAEVYDEASETMCSYNGSGDDQNVKPFFHKRKPLISLH